MVGGLVGTGDGAHVGVEGDEHVIVPAQLGQPAGQHLAAGRENDGERPGMDGAHAVGGQGGAVRRPAAHLPASASPPSPGRRRCTRPGPGHEGDRGQSGRLGGVHGQGQVDTVVAQVLAQPWPETVAGDADGETGADAETGQADGHVGTAPPGHGREVLGGLTRIARSRRAPPVGAMSTRTSPTTSTPEVPDVCGPILAPGCVIACDSTPPGLPPPLRGRRAGAGAGAGRPWRRPGGLGILSSVMRPIELGPQPAKAVLFGRRSHC